MCDYIPSDPILAVFNEPIKCPHEMIFYLAFLSSTGELLSEHVQKIKVQDGKAEKTNNTH